MREQRDASDNCSKSQQNALIHMASLLLYDYVQQKFLFSYINRWYKLPVVLPLEEKHSARLMLACKEVSPLTLKHHLLI